MTTQKQLTPSQIKKITKSNSQQDVFDISVEESKHYILENGLVSHNSGAVYAASIVIVMQKRKLKEDEQGNKITEVAGIRSAVQVEKSRYAKPFEKCELKIPYSTGLSPYTGMFDFCIAHEVLTKVGNRYQYIDKDGVVHIHFRKDIPESLYDIIINEWVDKKVDDNVEIESASVIDEH